MTSYLIFKSGINTLDFLVSSGGYDWFETDWAFITRDDSNSDTPPFDFKILKLSL